ncbi:MAG: hypothetical protein Q7V01_11560 [Vicinamibacterales bacterium]|nr:hypothetical protein [Vicinamibacterales bacterium]
MNRTVGVAAAGVLWAVAAVAATPPPVYDFCAAEIEVVVDESGHATYAGDTCDGDNQVLDHLCGGFATHMGREDYYAIPLAPGQTFTAVVAHTGDAVLLVTDVCIVFGTMFPCLAGADAAGPGGVETITYANPGTAATIHLVIDSHTTAGCGSYSLELSIQDEVAAERSSFGAVKAVYR